MENLEKLLILCTFGVFLWIIILILLNYSKNLLMSKLMKAIKKKNKIVRCKKENNLKNTGDIYYEQARSLFKNAISNGKITRDKILELVDFIEVLLGKYKNNYNKFTFKNDAHKIYIYLKSQHLNQLDYEQISNFIIKSTKEV